MDQVRSKLVIKRKETVQTVRNRVFVLGSCCEVIDQATHCEKGAWPGCGLTVVQ